MYLFVYIVPGEPPLQFMVTVSSSTSAYLTWSPPSVEQQNGIITKYVINMTVQETGEHLQFMSSTTSLVVNNLRPYRTYEWIIAAATSDGIGPFSDPVTVVTPEDGE